MTIDRMPDSPEFADGAPLPPPVAYRHRRDEQEVGARLTPGEAATLAGLALATGSAALAGALCEAAQQTANVMIRPLRERLVNE